MEFIERIVNVETNEIIETPYNELQLKELKEAQTKLKAEQENQIKQAAAKAALLERLGITEEEAKLLLG